MFLVWMMMLSVIWSILKLAFWAVWWFFKLILTIANPFTWITWFLPKKERKDDWYLWY